MTGQPGSSLSNQRYDLPSVHWELVDPAVFQRAEERVALVVVTN